MFAGGFLHRKCLCLMSDWTAQRTACGPFQKPTEQGRRFTTGPRQACFWGSVLAVGEKQIRYVSQFQNSCSNFFCNQRGVKCRAEERREPDAGGSVEGSSFGDPLQEGNRTGGGRSSERGRGLGRDLRTSFPKGTAPRVSSEPYLA